MSTTAANPAAAADRGAAEVVRAADHAFRPLDAVERIFRRSIEETIKAHYAHVAKMEQDRRYEIPTMTTTARGIKEAVINFHVLVLEAATTKSEQADEMVSSLLSKALCWLNCFHLGQAFVELISKRMGWIARQVTFFAIQAFHVLPYMAAAGVIAGSILLFQTSPISLIVVLAGATFTIQMLQSYFLSKNAERAGNLIEHATSPEEVAKTVNLAQEGVRVKIEEGIKGTVQSVPVTGKYLASQDWRQRAAAAATTAGVALGAYHLLPAYALAGLAMTGAAYALGTNSAASVEAAARAEASANPRAAAAPACDEEAVAG